MVRFGPTWSQSQTGPIKSQVKPNQTKSTWSLKSNRTGRTDRSHRPAAIGPIGPIGPPLVNLILKVVKLALKVVNLTSKWSFWLESGQFDLQSGISDHVTLHKFPKKENFFPRKLKIMLYEYSKKGNFRTKVQRVWGFEFLNLFGIWRFEFVISSKSSSLSRRSGP